MSRIAFTEEEFAAATKIWRERMQKSILAGFSEEDKEIFNEAVKQGDNPVQKLLEKHGITLSEEEINEVVKKLMGSEDKISDNKTITDEIIEMYNAGMNIEEIADFLDMEESHVFTILDENEV